MKSSHSDILLPAACLLFALLAGCSQTPRSTRVDFLLPAEGSGKVRVYVGYINGSPNIDTTLTVTGESAGIDLPADKTLASTITHDNKNAIVILDGSKITVDFTKESPEVSSSAKNSVNYRFLEYNRRGDEIERSIGEAFKNGNSKTAAELLEKRYGMELDAASSEKDNYIGVKAIVGLRAERHRVSLKQLDSIISTMDSSVIKTGRIKEVREQIQTQLKTQPGMMFTDFGALDGARLSDYVGKGKYVLVDFWASWCGPCRKEIPFIKDVHEKYSGERFTVVGATVWDSVEASRKAIDELSMNWPQLLESGGAEAYGIEGIPHLILFAPDGTILSRDLRGATIEDTVKRYLAE